MSDKRFLILEAAEKLFLSRRYHEVTVDDVAKKVGVGKGTIYRYFEDKDDLYYQIILTGMDQLVRSLQHTAGKKKSTDQEIRCIVQKLVKFFNDRKGLFFLMHSAQLRRSCHRKNLWKDWREKKEHIVNAVAAVIRQGMNTGRYKRSLSPNAAASLLIDMARSAIWHRKGMPVGKDLSRVLSDLFENGLCSRR